MEKTAVTNEQLAEFVTVVQGVVNAYMAKEYPTLPRRVITVDLGRRYARIVQTASGSGNVYCFVDLTNGDIRKAASWKIPARGVCGSVHDLEAVRRVLGASGGFF